MKIKARIVKTTIAYETVELDIPDDKVLRNGCVIDEDVIVKEALKKGEVLAKDEYAFLNEETDISVDSYDANGYHYELNDVDDMLIWNQDN